REAPQPRASFPRGGVVLLKRGANRAGSRKERSGRLPFSLPSAVFPAKMRAPPETCLTFPPLDPPENPAMLTLSDGRTTRRGFLTLGTLGLGGLSLPSLLAAADSRSSHVTGRSVIFLFQQGGPSQFETFDPKPDAPAGVRTVT